MRFVYLIQNPYRGFYIGCSKDTDARLSEHNSGQVESTKNSAPWKLVYYEAYTDDSKAFEREKKLKQFGSAYTALLKRLGFK